MKRRRGAPVVVENGCGLGFSRQPSGRLSRRVLLVVVFVAAVLVD